MVGEGHPELTLVTEQDRLIGVEPGDTTAQVLGAAVDIGTTTIALYLCDLAAGKVLSGSATANSQAAFGADVMSRISHCIESPKGLEQLGRLVREDIALLLGEACAEAGVEPDYLYRWVLVGNTTMQHLFLGLDPASLGRSPYLPRVNGAVEFQPAELGLKGAPCAKGVFLSTVAGHVGADLVAVALAAGLKENNGLSLAVDLGTNGEIVLADRGRLLCCSTAAGPAFEGARIRYGMRAEPGAIDRFWIDGKGEPRFHLIGDKKVPAGICGSGLLDLASELLRVGVIDTSGWILPPEKLKGKLARSLARRLETGENGQWEFVIFQALKRGEASRVTFTQRDVRELQLAAGAISSGIRILLKLTGRSPAELDQVLLTGAFGHYLNPASALRIGLISGVGLERIQSIGNAAGLGARLALLDTGKLEESCRLAAEMEFVELAALPDWQAEFTESMFFPER
ncbi:MAG: hypothetical protein A3F83_05690 [Candidatus Glassbacteria bacterium RIFCSPLOWO2_12_FULL_58_11]|uniref:Ferredoxin n=1 Tax=Candidatus Glassbacteria bacterium RIFCSPLOWO2_12_FULL_58_11 TaxID=1817867 RepID=A0A1F5YKZ7_9BACT|nr:MAG: hypothetical protein A3F83_05690 [Candidatus Glassbacteria bacterium RIFCSPLOWO2_12_FULL_58_11]